MRRALIVLPLAVVLAFAVLASGDAVSLFAARQAARSAEEQYDRAALDVTFQGKNQNHLLLLEVMESDEWRQRWARYEEAREIYLTTRRYAR